jgi:magnesium chelatase family protein
VATQREGRVVSSPLKNAFNTLKCATLEGVNAKVIDVEATFTKGLPGFSIVGLASTDIQEAKERVKSALLLNEFLFPPLRITIGLSPSETRKSGSHFDLSLALLIALHKESVEHEGLFVFGELSLDGRIKSSMMLFPLILSLKEQNLIQRAIIPQEALEHLSYISGVEFIPVSTLKEAIGLMQTGAFESQSCAFEYRANSITIEHQTFYYQERYEEDFIDVKGQMIAKRAALIAAAGMHNLFMEGSPGSGKSMIAKRLRDILPPLAQKEILSIAKHQFLDGHIPSFDAVRPMRSPHHTATSASIFGGGSGVAKIGEVALASRGLLFFDELPHFSKPILEAMREPLQDQKVHIARVNAKISYEADILFVTAQNPCLCGNLLSKTIPCRCTESEKRRYNNRLSDPFLDRMDLFVVMQEIQSSDAPSESSALMHQRVIEAFRKQKGRQQPNLNGKLKEGEIDRYCILSPDASTILDAGMTRFSLSHRSIASIKKVARTIADLNEHERIEKRDLLEALSYRRRK